MSAKSKPKKRTKNEQRYLNILRDGAALIDGWKCPICGQKFRDQDACPHGWAAVRRANEDFMLSVTWGETR